MMVFNNIAFGIILFLEVIQYFIFFDILLSFLILIGVKFRPKFLKDILDPLYELIRKNIPVFFGPFDFTPIILIFFLKLMQVLLINIFPGVLAFY